MGMSMFAGARNFDRSDRIIYVLGGGYDVIFACEKTTRKADGRWFDVETWLGPLFKKDTFYCVNLIGSKIVGADRLTDLHSAIAQSTGLPKCMVDLVISYLYISGFADDQI